MRKFLLSLTALVASVHCNSQIIEFSDPNLKEVLMFYGSASYINFLGDYAPLYLDANFDGEISIQEASVATGLTLHAGNISDYSDLQYFINVESVMIDSNEVLTSLSLPDLPLLHALHCNNNDNLVNIDLSNMPQLQTLNCRFNAISALDTSLNPLLTSVNCSYNQISTLSFESNPLLTTIDCSSNNLASLTVAGLSSLTSLICNTNQLTALDISDQNLTILKCGENPITSLELSGQTNLTNLNCRGTLIEVLDLSFKNIQTVNCSSSSQLRTVYLKNGGTDHANLASCPQLEYICADEFEYSTVNQYLGFDGNDVEINSYCSFVPGGVVYEISGNARFDSNGDGCDSFDPYLEAMRFDMTNGTTSGSFISAGSGYSISVAAGIHTITPTLEMPDYFTVSPTSATVDFPTTGNAATQDFCLDRNGNHADGEVVLMPLVPARPGFDASYGIIVRNKGTVGLTLPLYFTFDAERVSFLSASLPAEESAEGEIFCYVNNLQPFESRTILVNVHINSPVSEIPVNNGDVLAFEAQLFNPEDEMMDDNSSVLQQTVVGSYDPNDITCLEGNTIAPAMVGDYVHYLVRFENTGTFAAENVVVMNPIDPAKFDLSTLVPLSGSHNFRTRISQGNKVEFIFENISLPFDDANNDGFVSYKIKTKPTLVLGDTFSNTAAIYFDYNFPIITNTETTTISALANPDFDFGRFFTLYPNPANDKLNIVKTAEITVSSLSIYNMLGQQLVRIPNAAHIHTIDVATLQSGTYFIRITSDKGSSSMKFIKQ